MTKIEGITIEINGETKKLTTAIKNLNTPINRVQNELKNVENLLKMNPGNVELLTRKEKALAQAVTDTKSKLQALEQAQEQANQTIAEGGEVSESQYAKLQSEIDKTRLKLQNLEEAQRSFGSVSAQQLAAVGAKVEDVGNKVSDVGKSFAPVSAAAAGAISVGVKSAMDLETAFTGVAKTVEATPQQLEAITKGIEEMSMRTASSVEDIAAVAEAAGQLGIATDDVLDFTETMIMLGDTTNLTADEAASALAKFANITGTTADNYGRLGAVIVDLGNNFATTEADIVAMATRLAGTGAQIGLTESEIMALAAAMSSVGIEAEAGGTAMTQTFSAMEKAVANGGDKLQQFADIAGVSADEFAAMWQKKPIDAITAFIQGLGELEGKGESATLVLDEMGLSGIRQSDMLKRLSGAADVMSDAIDTANIAWSENTALTEEAQKKYDTAAAKLQQMKNALVIAAGNIGEVFLPVLKAVAEMTTKVSQAFASMPESIKVVVAVFLTLTAALAPLLLLFGRLTVLTGQIMQYAPQIAAAFAKISPVLSVISKAFSGVFGAIKLVGVGIKSLLPIIGGALVSPIGIAVVAITGLITAFTLLWKNCESFRNFFINAFNSIKSAVVPIIENIKAVISSLWTNSIMPVLQNIGSQLMPIIQDIFGQLAVTFQACMPMIQEIGNSFADIFGALVEAGGQIINSLIPLFQSLVSMVLPIVQTLISAVLGTIQSIMPAVKGLLSTILPLVQAAISALLPIIQTILTTIMAVIATILPIIQAAVTIIMPIIQTAIALISTIIQTIAPIIIGIINFIVPLITNAINTITVIIQAITPVVQSIVNFIVPIIQAAVTMITGIIRGITTVLQGIANFVKGVFTGNWQQAWQGIKQIFSGVINSIKAIFQGFANTVKSIVDGIKGVFTVAGNAIKSVFTAVGSAISGALSNAAGVIKSAMTAAANGIKSVWGSITSFFSGIVSRIVGVFQSLPGKMVSIGRNMVQGIINGITGAAGALISKMKSLATSALNAAKSALGIHSPSRIMRDVVGKNIVLGISDGIYKNKTNVTDAMKEVSQNILSEAEEILDIQKSLGEISEEQELAYWKNIRNITGLQGEELLAVDKKIAEKEKSILEAQQAEQEKYLQEFESKVDKIAGFSNIFSEVEFEKVSGKDLTKNLQTQVWALEEYSEIMQELAKRGISDALFAELQEQGVGAIDELRALARMSDEELAKYDSLYTEKMQLAAEQAAKEMGIASVGIVDSVAEAVESLNTNASVVVNQAENNQETLLDLIATKVAEYVGNALLSGLVGIQDTILASMPETLNLNLDGKRVAQTMWFPLDRLGDKKNRLFAPTRQQIANIALSVVGKWGE